jgi:hypothetical protein
MLFYLDLVKFVVNDLNALRIVFRLWILIDRTHVCILEILYEHVRIGY